MDSHCMGDTVKEIHSKSDPITVTKKSVFDHTHISIIHTTSATFTSLHVSVSEFGKLLMGINRTFLEYTLINLEMYKVKGGQ